MEMGPEEVRIGKNRKAVHEQKKMEMVKKEPCIIG